MLLANDHCLRIVGHGAHDLTGGRNVVCGERVAGCFQRGGGRLGDIELVREDVGIDAGGTVVDIERDVGEGGLAGREHAEIKVKAGGIRVAAEHILVNLVDHPRGVDDLIVAVEELSVGVSVLLGVTE